MLFTGQRSIIGPVANKEDEGGGCSSRKYAAHVQLTNRGALVSHRQGPDGQENRNDTGTRPAAGREPYHDEAEMRQQRDAEGEGCLPRPDDASRWLVLIRGSLLRAPNNSGSDVDAARKAGHRCQD